MSKLFKNKAFKYGFISGVVLCSMIQLLDYKNNISEREELIRISQFGLHIDTVSHWGIPFPVFYGRNFMPVGFVTNILIALVFSFLLGLTFKFVRSKISSRHMK